MMTLKNKLEKMNEIMIHTQHPQVYQGFWEEIYPDLMKAVELAESLRFLGDRNESAIIS